jgi:hypothetical protein
MLASFTGENSQRSAWQGTRHPAKHDLGIFPANRRAGTSIPLDDRVVCLHWVASLGSGSVSFSTGKGVGC